MSSYLLASNIEAHTQGRTHESNFDNYGGWSGRVGDNDDYGGYGGYTPDFVTLKSDKIYYSD